MKNGFIQVLAVIAAMIIMLGFAGCTAESEQTQSAEATRTVFPTMRPYDAEVKIPRPASFRYYYFFSIDDAYFILAYVTHQGDDGKTYNSIMEAKEEYGSICADTVEALRNRELKMAVPFIDGRRMETEGQDPIIFMTKELFNLPWMWYMCTVDGISLTVKICFVSVLKNAKIDAAKSFLEVQKLVAPNAPTPDNYKEYDYSNYSLVYEKDLTTADGAAVKVLIMQNADGRVYLHMLQNGMLITLYGDDKTVVNEDLIKRFEVKTYYYLLPNE